MSQQSTTALSPSQAFLQGMQYLGQAFQQLTQQVGAYRGMYYAVHKEVIDDYYAELQAQATTDTEEE